MKVIINKLNSNININTLDPGYDQIDNDGSIEIANLLKINSTLQSLDLSYNKINKEKTNVLKSQFYFAITLFI